MPRRLDPPRHRKGTLAGVSRCPDFTAPLPDRRCRLRPKVGPGTRPRPARPAPPSPGPNAERRRRPDHRGPIGLGAPSPCGKRGGGEGRWYELRSAIPWGSRCGKAMMRGSPASLRLRLPCPLAPRRFRHPGAEARRPRSETPWCASRQSKVLLPRKEADGVVCRSLHSLGPSGRSAPRSALSWPSTAGTSSTWKSGGSPERWSRIRGR